MHIVFFSHPDFLPHQSMPRFLNMLEGGMRLRGHTTEIWTAPAFFFNFTKIRVLKKWLGYLDQYIVFPLKIKRQIRGTDRNTLFVFCDHALGPWVPLVKKRFNVMHCHDFLAQQAALGKLKFNKIGFSGKVYQKFIRNGYTQCHNFISVSKKTKNDLHVFLKKEPLISKVVYNGLNRTFSEEKVSLNQLRMELSQYFNLRCKNGYILHIGGNQWYKNRGGILSIYETWRFDYNNTIPLILIGEKPDIELLKQYEASSFKEDIIFLSGVNDEMVNKFYQAASVFLFPSLAEGFGWPIAEAMASGCLVITTNEAPMNEVGSDAAFYIPIMPNNDEELNNWVKKSSVVLQKVIDLSQVETSLFVTKGLANAKRFSQDKALNAIEHIYKEILKQELI
tara:strand:+ start:20715 stop:21893 length:1179 start_codon:yes stop_codon:yes gene_type:complete